MLTPKRARFVEEYLVDVNGKAAAIRAGYSPKNAEVQASRLLSYVKVRVALQDAMQARSKRTQVTADRVIAEYAVRTPRLSDILCRLPRAYSLMISLTCSGFTSYENRA